MFEKQQEKQLDISLIYIIIDIFKNIPKLCYSELNFKEFAKSLKKNI